MSLASQSSASFAPSCRSAPCHSRTHLGRARRALPFRDARSRGASRCPNRAHSTEACETGRHDSLIGIPAATAVALLLPALQPTAAAAATAIEAGMQAGSAPAVQAGQLVPQLVSATAELERWSATAAAGAADHAQLLYQLSDLDGRTAGAISLVLRPILSISTLLMISRIILSWYPQIDGKKFPWALSVAPTEPVLGPTRRLIPPVGGVDVSPIVWVALLSFINEILLGPQGILNLLQRKLDL